MTVVMAVVVMVVAMAVAMAVVVVTVVVVMVIDVGTFCGGWGKGVRVDDFTFLRTHLEVMKTFGHIAISSFTLHNITPLITLATQYKFYGGRTNNNTT